MLIFIHIPKCSGSTVGMRILNSYGEDSTVSMAWNTMASFAGLWDHHLREGREIRWVGGHVQYGIHRFLPIPPESARYITFLREPAPQIVSLYYFSRNNPDTHYHALATRLTLEEWLHSNERPRDVYTYTLSGYFQEKSLSSARRNLFRNIEFFEITEQFEKSMAILADKFGVTATEPAYINETKKPRDLPLPMDDIRAIVAGTDHQDVTLYREALRVFLDRYP